MRQPPLAHILTLVVFIVNSFGPIPMAQAQDFVLPKPGVMVHLSPPENPAILKGIKVHTDNPFRFDFILDKGDSAFLNLRGSGGLKEESAKLIKYFLASLTIPEKDLWVNLSPYEKDRIVPDSFGVTEMGRDLLAQDYMLKQITASLIYPEDEVGKKFWKRIYEEAQKKYGNTNMPVNTFNKVWIVPEKAVVYENAKAGTAYVVESRLKVMLEEDYLSMSKHATGTDSNSAVRPILGQELVSLPAGRQVSPNNVKASQGNPDTTNDINQIGSQIIREIVIPELTKEINEGKNFSQLRQVYNSLILATWYKKKIKDSILSQVYSDKSKTQGINIDDPQEKQKIYQQYLQAFKKGVYNYIKEESDPSSGQMIPKKYFSGGFGFAGNMNAAMTTTPDAAMIPRNVVLAALMVVSAGVQSASAEPKDVPSKRQIGQIESVQSIAPKVTYKIVNDLRIPVVSNVTALIEFEKTKPKDPFIIIGKNSVDLNDSRIPIDFVIHAATVKGSHHKNYIEAMLQAGHVVIVYNYETKDLLSKKTEVLLSGYLNIVEKRKGFNIANIIAFSNGATVALDFYLQAKGSSDKKIRRQIDSTNFEIVAGVPFGSLNTRYLFTPVNSLPAYGIARVYRGSLLRTLRWLEYELTPGAEIPMNFARHLPEFLASGMHFYWGMEDDNVPKTRDERVSFMPSQTVRDLYDVHTKVLKSPNAKTFPRDEHTRMIQGTPEAVKAVMDSLNKKRKSSNDRAMNSDEELPLTWREGVSVTVKQMMGDIIKTRLDDHPERARWLAPVEYNGTDQYVIDVKDKKTVRIALMEIINNALDHHSSKNESDLIQIKINPSAEGKGLTIGINISNDGPVAYQALRNKAEEFANRGLLLKKNSENNDKNADEYVVSYGTKAGYYSIGRNEVAFIGDIELVFIYGLSAGKKENSIGGNGVGLKLSRRLMRSMGGDLKFEPVELNGFAKVTVSLLGVRAEAASQAMMALPLSKYQEFFGTEVAPIMTPEHFEQYSRRRARLNGFPRPINHIVSVFAGADMTNALVATGARNIDMIDRNYADDLIEKVREILLALSTDTGSVKDSLIERTKIYVEHKSKNGNAVPGDIATSQQMAEAIVYELLSMGVAPDQVQVEDAQDGSWTLGFKKIIDGVDAFRQFRFRKVDLQGPLQQYFPQRQYDAYFESASMRKVPSNELANYFSVWASILGPDGVVIIDSRAARIDIEQELKIKGVQAWVVPGFDQPGRSTYGGPDKEIIVLNPSAVVIESLDINVSSDQIIKGEILKKLSLLSEQYEKEGITLRLASKDEETSLTSPTGILSVSKGSSVRLRVFGAEQSRAQKIIEEIRVVLGDPAMTAGMGRREALTKMGAGALAAWLFGGIELGAAPISTEPSIDIRKELSRLTAPRTMETYGKWMGSIPSQATALIAQIEQIKIKISTPQSPRNTIPDPRVVRLDQILNALRSIKKISGMPQSELDKNEYGFDSLDSSEGRGLFTLGDARDALEKISSYQGLNLPQKEAIQMTQLISSIDRLYGLSLLGKPDLNKDFVIVMSPSSGEPYWRSEHLMGALKEKYNVITFSFDPRQSMDTISQKFIDALKASPYVSTLLANKSVMVTGLSLAGTVIDESIRKQPDVFKNCFVAPISGNWGGTPSMFSRKYVPPFTIPSRYKELIRSLHPNDPIQTIRHKEFGRIANAPQKYIAVLVQGDAHMPVFKDQEDLLRKAIEELNEKKDRKKTNYNFLLTYYRQEKSDLHVHFLEELALVDQIIYKPILGWDSKNLFQETAHIAPALMEKSPFVQEVLALHEGFLKQNPALSMRSKDRAMAAPLFKKARTFNVVVDAISDLGDLKEGLIVARALKAKDPNLDVRIIVRRGWEKLSILVPGFDSNLDNHDQTVEGIRFLLYGAKNTRPGAFEEGIGLLDGGKPVIVRTIQRSIQDNEFKADVNIYAGHMERDVTDLFNPHQEAVPRAPMNFYLGEYNKSAVDYYEKSPGKLPKQDRMGNFIFDISSGIGRGFNGLYIDENDKNKKISKQEIMRSLLQRFQGGQLPNDLADREWYGIYAHSESFHSGYFDALQYALQNDVTFASKPKVVFVRENAGDLSRFNIPYIDLIQGKVGNSTTSSNVVVIKLPKGDYWEGIMARSEVVGVTGNVSLTDALGQRFLYDAPPNKPEIPGALRVEASSAVPDLVGKYPWLLFKTPPFEARRYAESLYQDWVKGASQIFTNPNGEVSDMFRKIGERMTSGNSIVERMIGVIQEQEDKTQITDRAMSSGDQAMNGESPNKKPKTIRETERLIQYMRKAGNEPKKILIVLGNLGRNIGWGDIILEQRVLVASLLKTWKGHLSDIVIVSEYPEIFKELGQGEVRNIRPDQTNNLRDFDLIFNCSNPHAPLDNYSEPLIQKYQASNSAFINYWEVTSIAAFMRSMMSKPVAIRNSITGIGLEVASREEYTMSFPKKFPFKTIFVNFHAVTQHDLSRSMQKQWVEMISALLNKGYNVIVNKGEEGNEGASTFTQEVLAQVPRVLNTGSIESRAFHNREALLNYLEINIDLVVTIDTGIFWAAQEILGLPSVVIDSENSSYIEPGDKDSFRVIDFHNFEQNPLGVLEQMQDFAMNSSKVQFKSSDTGGIDFNSDKINLQIQNAGEGIKFNINPAMLLQLQNASGFTPVIINMEPLKDLRLFLGVNDETPLVQSG